MRRGDERLLRPVREASALPALRAGLEAIALVKLLEEQGNLLRRPQPGALGDGLFELRGKQVRLLYLFLPGRVIVLLGGEIKKRDDIPAGTLARMRALQAEKARVRVSPPFPSCSRAFRARDCVATCRVSSSSSKRELPQGMFR
jgi:hypothetical protein